MLVVTVKVGLSSVLATRELLGSELANRPSMREEVVKILVLRRSVEV